MLRLNPKTLFSVAAALSVAAMVTSCGSATGTTSAKAGLWVTMPDKSMLLQPQDVTNNASATNVQLTINPATTYQVMDGFGYTLTGGSAMHLMHMSATAREKLLQELYGTGAGNIGVSYIRISVGASDLDEKVFSYDDLAKGETDMPLAKFDLGYDKQYLIPILQQILKINP